MEIRILLYCIQLLARPPCQQPSQIKMAAPTENMLDQENKLFCNIEATVATGFELVAKEEAEEKCGSVTKVSRGNINIRVPVENAEKVN